MDTMLARFNLLNVKSNILFSYLVGLMSDFSLPQYFLLRRTPPSVGDTERRNNSGSILLNFIFMQSSIIVDPHFWPHSGFQLVAQFAIAIKETSQH